MCAISGIFDLSGRGVTHDALVRFTDAMAHRGPDGAGYWLEDGGRLGLGHRRLAILDCSASGAQPMEAPEARRKIVFNGEIYNFIELRRELEALGYGFRSETDTEVILHAFDAWGPACLEKFNGMWAFAIWDARAGTLFLSRDRFGVKPLHLVHEPGWGLAFASETLAFASLDGYRREIDPARLATAVENVFRLEGAGETIFRGIRQLLPGHYAIFDGHELRETRWWNTLDHLGGAPADYDQAAEQFGDLFESACRLRLRSDVPVGSALSGGLDSSAVVGMTHRLASRQRDVERLPASWQTAFIHSMPGSEIDETAYAREVVSFLGGNAHVIELDTNNLVERIVRETRQLDFIYLTPSIMVDVYRRMRESGVVVSLDGHGVDEMLYGYPDLVELAWQDAVNRGDPAAASDLGEVLVAMLLPSRQQAMRKRLRAYGRSPSMWSRLRARFRRPDPHGPAGWLKARPASLKSPNYALTAKGFSPSERALYMNFHEWVLPTLLRNYDRVAMLSGVEIRMPFMDWRLVTFAFGLPQSAKVGHGFTKRILRDSARGLMPESIRTRTLKIGWNAPMHEWFSRELRGWLMDEMSSRAFLDSEIWDGPKIRAFSERRMAAKSWTFGECSQVWPYINAHLLAA